MHPDQIDLDDIELHDAILKGMSMDFSAAKMTLAVEYYETVASSQRIPAMIEFVGIETISQIADCKRLKKNAVAGNVNYWVPKSSGGTTYIYLVDGCISIKAKTLCFIKET